MEIKVPIGPVRKIRLVFFFSSRRRHTRSKRDWSSDVCSSDLSVLLLVPRTRPRQAQEWSYAIVIRSRAILFQIGRASCRKECRSRWPPYHEKKKKKRCDQQDSKNQNVHAEDALRHLEW